MRGGGANGVNQGTHPDEGRYICAMTAVMSLTCFIGTLVGLVVTVVLLVRKLAVLLRAVRTLIDTYRKLFR